MTDTGIKQQAKDLLTKSHRILLITREHPTEDSVGCLLALGLVLEKMGKEISLVCHGPLSSTLSFLPKFEHVSKQLEVWQNFVISLDTSEAKVAKFSYDFDEDGNKLNIYITPEGGYYRPEHVSTEVISSHYDVIVTLDTPDLEYLGSIYREHRDFFYQTPIINIDHNPANREYGEINFVDPTSASTAEVLYLLIESLGKSYVDNNVATSLLAGIISGTRSFQKENTSPKSFTIAAQLIALGADQQKIVRHMFKNRSLTALKLWGRALARVKYDPLTKLGWTVVTLADFEKSGATKDDLTGLEEELFSSISGLETFLLLYEEQANRVEGWVVSNREDEAARLAQVFATSYKGNRVGLVFQNKGVVQLEEEVVNKIKQH